MGFKWAGRRREKDTQMGDKLKEKSEKHFPGLGPLVPLGRRVDTNQ